jgi:hypothetical protein
MPPRHRAGQGGERGCNAQDLCHPTSDFGLPTSDVELTKNHFFNIYQIEAIGN